MSSSEWKFFKTRPSNFPTIRISQFASFIFKSPGLFSQLLSIDSLANLYQHFKLSASGYWEKHYMFDKKAAGTSVSLGKESVQVLAINTIIPLLAAYSQYKNDPILMDQAVALLEALPAEKNKIITRWQQLGMAPLNAFESQGAIELYNEYCLKRACLNCQIGSQIIRPVAVQAV